ncbi:MAG: aldo/keto reductase [Anaerolineaceae bacterium]
MLKRTLGKSGIEVSPMGLGCWAIGGPFWKKDQPVGWGQVNDPDSIRAIQHALDLGITFFDTADVYGCGHSEQVLGKALAGRRDQVTLATKFGQEFDEQTRQVIGYNYEPTHIRNACEASLKRLSTDHIDLYQLHIKTLDREPALIVMDTLEQLVDDGKILYYGWSTDDPERARLFANGNHCTAIQLRLNLLEDNAETLAVCEKFNLAAINRSPLIMGLLTGKFKRDTVIPSDDVRSRRPTFAEERSVYLDKLDRVREILTLDGRTLAQGALGWLWARSKNNIPIPGFKTIDQVEENIHAQHFGPLTGGQMAQIAAILG